MTMETGQTPTTTANSAGITLGTAGTGQTPQPAPATDAQSAAPQTDQTEQTATVDSLPGWAQDLIRELRDENKKRRLDAAAARQKAEEDRLAEQQKWQELAEKRAHELSAANARIDELAAVSDRVMAAADAEIAKWPDEVKVMRPEGATAAGLLTWMESARPLVARLTAPAPAPGAGPTPKPSTPAALTADLRKRAQERIARTF